MNSSEVLHSIAMLPLLVAERPKSDVGKPFALSSEFRPAGDQPQAIDELCEGLARGERDQVLLGVTGSGKTFTMAHVIARTGRPAIILAPNKTLAAQLYGEMKSFFPENAVEYFVSYYDYYQPEAYVPRTDTYVEKESSLNEEIDRMRHSATRAILERRDVIVVASVSCIYGIGSVETYSQMTLALAQGDRVNRTQLLARFVELQYRRNDHNFARGAFRVRGDTIELFPAHYEDRAWRIVLVRRRDRGDPRDRPADRRKDRFAAVDQDLRQQPLRDTAPDPAAGDRADQARPQDPARRTCSPRANCWRRSGSSSAPPTISK